MSMFLSRRVPHKRGDLAPTPKNYKLFFLGGGGRGVSVKLSLLIPKITLQIQESRRGYSGVGFRVCRSVHLHTFK